MAAGNFVVVRRTISQTIVPLKEVEERLLLKRSKAKSTSLGFSSTNNVARCGVNNTQDTKKTQRSLGLERSRSEVCLRRKNYVRDISLDVFEERRDEGLVKPVVRRRDASQRKVNTARPQSDFFPEFTVESKRTERDRRSVDEKTAVDQSQDPGKRLGRCIATLRREMMSLRKQDQALLTQLTSLNQHIQDLKVIAAAQGGIFGANEEHEDSPEKSLTNPCCPNKDTLINGKTRTKQEREKSFETRKKEPLPKPIKNEQNSSKKIKNGVHGLQETSFEYVEAPRDTTTPRQVRPKANASRSQSTTIVDVSRKRVASLQRLERRSLSCQLLDSGRQDKVVEGNNTRRTSESARKQRPLSQIDADVSKQAKDANIRQKSLSLSTLRHVTKTTEGSTSDSECSTSGCYGGSSTGSDVELERGMGCFNAKSSIECREKLDKVFELNSLNLQPLGKRYLALNEQAHFRKKIVSV
ncbi:uncharacterized protein LOC114541339 [Dendronephthya gigantea]|uniref:uncharacterized protein LOC114541339 n=1 Tax=Dendronephthya gigantea TaxID=151771 RepID=UPI00106D487C|nr:uncharacterized protein LOC114541339 [Dendronephthya gigantea]